LLLPLPFIWDCIPAEKSFPAAKWFIGSLGGWLSGTSECVIFVLYPGVVGRHPKVTLFALIALRIAIPGVICID